MSDDDRTHYDVLGVDKGARKDEIRDAYRERLDAAQAERQRLQEAKRSGASEVDAARDEEARVREAWQVLSDPYQRGRYDQRLEVGIAGAGVAGVANGEAGSPEVVADDHTPARRAQPGRGAAGGRPRPQTMMSPDPVDPPPGWPAGLRPPPNRARSTAMFIDIIVLFVLFTAVSMVGQNIIESKQLPQAEHDRLVAAQLIDPSSTKYGDALDDVTENMTHFKDRQEHFEDIADDNPNRVIEQRGSNKRCPQGDPGADARAQRLANCFENLYEEARERRSDLVGDLQTATFAVLGVSFLAMMLYLVPSSVISGRTLGKRLLWIRLVRDDGSPAGLRPSLLHYGLPILVALMLNNLFAAFLPGIGFLIVLLGIASWPRQPNKQGMHDRIAHTLVVDG